MIISIAGMPGSGKSTLAKQLSKKLGYTHSSMGDLQRGIPREKGGTIAELGRLEEQNRSTDNELDEKQRSISRTGDNIVIDGRLSFHFIPRSVKIFLTVDADVGAKRIFSHKREEEKAADISHIRQEISDRIRSEKKRFKKYYHVDPYDESNHDLVLDTSSLSSEQTLEKVARFIENNKKASLKPR